MKTIYLTCLRGIVQCESHSVHITSIYFCWLQTPTDTTQPQPVNMGIDFYITYNVKVDVHECIYIFNKWMYDLNFSRVDSRVFQKFLFSLSLFFCKQC